MMNIFENIRGIFEFAALGVTATFVKLLVVEDRRTFLGVVAAIASGLFVAVLSGLFISDLGINDGTKYALVGAAALIAENIIWAIVKLGRQIERYGPKAVMEHLKKKLNND